MNLGHSLSKGMEAIVRQVARVVRVAASAAVNRTSYFVQQGDIYLCKYLASVTYLESDQELIALLGVAGRRRGLRLKHCNESMDWIIKWDKSLTHNGFKVFHQKHNKGRHWTDFTSKRLSSPSLSLSHSDPSWLGGLLDFVYKTTQERDMWTYFGSLKNRDIQVKWLKDRTRGSLMVV